MTVDLQHKIYGLLKTYALPQLRYDNDLMNVLSSVWDVYQRKATGEDYRYKMLGDEIEKHYVMNDDWADDKLFVGILSIFDDETKFICFTEQITYMLRGNDGFEKYVAELSAVLAEENLELHEEQDGYKVRQKGGVCEVPKGALTFYVCDSDITNAVRFYEKDVKWPEDENCFVLTFDYLWNDYSYYTRYRLYYLKNGEPTDVGEVKIMKRGSSNTSEVLPKQFLALDNNYCSLGMSPSYYRRMRSLFGNDAHVVLRQLRDTAFYEAIYKDFEEEGIYKTSLLRDNDSDRARREGRYCVYGRDMDDAYAFKYKYELPYPGEDVEIDFNYKYSGQDYERIIGVIGENGVGKTTLIKKILQSLVTNDNRNFTSPRPLFSSVLMISYSPFDLYRIDTKGKAPFINYEYSGLMKDKELMFSVEEQVNTLEENIKTIYRRRYSFAKSWEELINKVIPIESVTKFIGEGDGNDVEVNKDGMLNLCMNASSGETMYLYSISAIMAKIRSDSLIIMDEPEQHLHPRAITALMHSLYKILEQYESYGLISTHSPYVIRELVSPNVMIFRRYDNELSVKRIGIESFGEDVSVLSDIVFGNMGENKRYEEFIQEVVERNEYDYEASIRELQKGPNALSLNAKLLVRMYIENKEDEAPEA